jgi:hypothetical protein
MKTRITLALAGLALACPLAASAASATIQGLSPGSQVIVGSTVTFTVAANGFTSPTYTLSDSFAGTSLMPTAIAGGAFNWVPQLKDVGNHIITVTVADGQSTTTVQQQVFVNSPPSVQIMSLAPGASVLPGQNVTFQTVASGFGAPSYAVSDSFTGSSVSSSDFTNSGAFTWTPQASDGGTHSLTVTVTDPMGHNATAQVAIVVASTPHVVVQGPTNASVGATTSLSFSAAGFTSPVFVVRDSTVGSSIGSGTMASSTFSWVPQPGDLGTHLLVVTASDPLAHVATATWTLSVYASSTPGTVVQPTPGAPTLPAPASTPLPGQAQGHIFLTFLRVGSRGDEVVALQQKLAGLGLLSSAATGYFGALTQAAVRAFQSAHGISPVGYVGPATRAALNQ